MLFRSNKLMHSDKVIQWSYVQKRLINKPAFRDDRIGATFALKHTVDLFIAQKTISELTAQQLLSRYHYIGRAYSMTDQKRIG